jgi:S1-C subfamily serine protease
VRIVLAAGGTVVGHVYDEKHAPVAGADIRFDAVSAVVESAADAKTDEAGAYRLAGAPSGLFSLRVQKQGFRVKLLSGLRVDGAGALTEDVTLAAGADGGPGLDMAGIGASIDQTAQGFVVRFVLPGGPAATAGIREGDRFVRVDADETDGLSITDLLQHLRGQEGTTVGVAVVRPETGERIDVVLVRAAITR